VGSFPLMLLGNSGLEFELNLLSRREIKSLVDLAPPLSSLFSNV
jgi:hypothetical protein